MTAFRDLSIRHKQLVTSVVVVVTALAVVIAAFIVSTFIYMRAGAQSDLAAQAVILGDNVSTALVFHDARAAEETLRGLAAGPTIDFGCVYGQDDQPVAHYVRSQQPFTCPTPMVGRVTTLTSIVLGSDVSDRGRRVGTLVVRRNLSDIEDTVRFELIVTFIALLLAAAASSVVGFRLQRLIVDPIFALVSTARQVSERSDYSIRATKSGNDEIGQLVETFNEMLTDIEQRDRDISAAAVERTQLLEREREANRVKDEFLAALSHELRTPLNAIVGWIQILQKTDPRPGTLSKALASIERNAQAQGRLIEDLLDISRIVSGKMVLKTGAADLVRVVESAVDVARGSAANKGVALNADLPKETCYVSGDADRLQQVVWNLLSNAIKFTPAGGRVDVTLRGQSGVYTVDVEDTGIGIDAAFLPYVFDRFRQADGSFTREHGGLGLGLAIAREIVDLHGGRIEVASAGRGSGSRFTVRLPALLGRDAGIQNASAPGARTEPRPLRDIRVLLVDDDEDAGEIAMVALTEGGAQVVVCDSAAEALEAIKHQRFDALVCDLAMPVMDGYGLLRAIREGQGQGAFLPAIAMSAYASQPDRRRTAEAGFQGHLAKPFELEVLVEMVRRVLARGQAV